jgi:protein-S-isoprenylcysteine O-methyltransferase Ste14
MSLDSGKKYLIKKRLRIPPVVFFMPCIVGGNIENFIFRKIEFSNNLLVILGLLIFIFAIVITLFSLRAFYSNNESPAPFIQTKKIITTGIFKYTRNPMYVAFFVSAFGISTVFSSFGILIGAIVGIVLIHRFVVLEEENKLDKIQGFENYKKSTRRWI